MDLSDRITVVMGTLDDFGKKSLRISILGKTVSILGKKQVDIVMIDTNIYCVTCGLKKAQLFAIFMSDIEY